MNYPKLIDECYRQWNADKPEIMAVDTETDGLLYQSKAFCVTVAWAGCSHFIDLEHVDPSRSPKLIKMFSQTKLLVGQNFKFDMPKLVHAGLIDEHEATYRPIADTMIMAHLLDERRSIRLKDLAREVLGEATDEEEVLKKVRRELKLKKDDGYHVLPRDVLVPYALKDAEFTFRLYNVFKPQIEARGLAEKEKMEYRLLRVIMDMETKGLRVDLPYVDKEIRRLGTEVYQIRKNISKLTQRKIFEDTDLDPVGGENKKQAKERAAQTTFNPNSPLQVLSVFESLGIQLTGTSKDDLGGVDHPLAHELLRMRECLKIRDTYLKAIRDEADGDILHPSFRVSGTRTGRFSSGLGE